MPAINIVTTEKSYLKHYFSFPDLKGEEGVKGSSELGDNVFKHWRYWWGKWGGLFHGYVWI